MNTSDTLFYVVKQASPETAKPQLMLFMHGYGSNEADLFSFAPAMPSNILVASVRAPITLAQGSYAWFHLNPYDLSQVSDAEISEAKRLLNNTVKAIIEKYGLSENPVWALGFSQGGMFAYWFMLTQPQQVQKAIIMSSYPRKNVIEPYNANQNFNSCAAYISHGYEDPVIAYNLGAEGQTLLSSLGVSTTFKSYHEGHGINQENFDDMLAWVNQNNK